MVSGLEGLRSLVHQYFLPALERCSVILSRLRGLARFYSDREDIGLSIPHLNRVLDTISCLTLVGHKVLIHTMDELQHFSAFSAWLRFQIDQLGGPGTGVEELTDKEAMMDHTKVLTYIERYLTNSPLDIFLNEIAKEDYDSDWDFIDDGPTLLDVLDKQLKKHEAGQPGMKALPHVDFLVNYASTWSNKIFSSIAEAKRRSVRFGRPVKLSIGKPITKMDMKMYGSSKRSGAVFTALASQQDPSKVHLFRMDMAITNGISDNKPVMACVVDLGSRSLADLKFLNDKTLVVFCTESSTFHFVHLKDCSSTNTSQTILLQSSSSPPKTNLCSHIAFTMLQIPARFRPQHQPTSLQPIIFQPTTRYFGPSVWKLMIEATLEGNCLRESVFWAVIAQHGRLIKYLPMDNVSPFVRLILELDHAIEREREIQIYSRRNAIFKNE